VFDVYMPSAAAVRLVDNFDTNAGSGRKQIYNGFDFTFNSRIPGGGSVFGGFTAEKTLRVICDEPDDPNYLRFCDDRDNGIPLTKQLKIAGTYPVGWGIQLSASLQSLQGRSLGSYTTAGNKISGPGYGDTGSPVGTQWLITRSTRYGAGCTGPCTPGALVIPGLTTSSVTVPLVVPGTEFLPRLNQVDLSLAKWFQIGSRSRVQMQVDLFNVLNANTILGVRSVNYGTGSYQQPSGILNGRTIRLGTQLRW